MRKEQLDETDKIILDMLQTNAKTPLKEMANRLISGSRQDRLKSPRNR